MSVDELLDRLWGSHLPERPREALHTCLSRLRRWLDAHDPGAARLISTYCAGYVLEIPAKNLDLLKFRDALKRAEAAAELVDQAAALDAALALWRGPVLPDVHSDSLHWDLVPSVTEECLRALSWRCEIGLSLGQHDRLVEGLTVAAKRYPYREGFWRQLMLALSRSGRPVEALKAYHQCSTFLRDEAGVDPGPELRKLHVAILREDLDARATP